MKTTPVLFRASLDSWRLLLVGRPWADPREKLRTLWEESIATPREGNGSPIAAKIGIVPTYEPYIVPTYEPYIRGSTPHEPYSSLISSILWDSTNRREPGESAPQSCPRGGQATKGGRHEHCPSAPPMDGGGSSFFPLGLTGCDLITGNAPEGLHDRHLTVRYHPSTRSGPTATLSTEVRGPKRSDLARPRWSHGAPRDPNRRHDLAGGGS